MTKKSKQVANKNLLGLWCFDKSTISDMKKLIKETKHDGNERAGLLCSDNKGKLKLYAKCTGNSCSIEKYEEDCKEGTVKIGTFHTHPKGNNLNLHDIQKSLERKEPIQCIGKATNGKIECFINKENYADLMEEKDTIDAMVKRGHEMQNCRELIQNNEPILKLYTNDYISRNLKKFNPSDYIKK